MRQPLLTCFASLAFLLCLGIVLAVEPVSGWRGNMTGVWPDAKPPMEWHRIPRGALDGMRSTATPPKGKESGDAPLVLKGLVRDWLVIGPFAVEDSVKDFDRDMLGGEATVEPVEGKKVGEVAWKAVSGPIDDVTVFGTAEMPFVDLAKAVGFKKNQFAYAHSYLYSPRGGPVRFVVDHGHGLKAWVNGKEVYRSPQRGVGLGFYTAISRNELSYTEPSSPRFEAKLKPGWNRLLLKVSSSNADGFTDMRFCLRVMDPPDVKYDTKNIVWMTQLPGRSTSTPIMVGDKLFLMAEPDELICIDKTSGKILWSAAVNYYEALAPEEKKANPGFAEKVDPLLAKLKAEPDRARRLKLRAEIRKTLNELNPARFKVPTNDHFEAHFGIVGFTMPTPVSDGKRVYVWCGMGVAACFDLDGKREWITRVKADHLSYGSSPALVDGVLVVFLETLFGLDAKTGKQLWQQKRIRNNVGSLLGATVAGKPLVVTQRGDFVRPSDGEIVFRPKDSTSPGDTGWAPPVILGKTMYAPKYGVTSLSVWDFKDADEEFLEPKLVKTIQLPPEVTRGPGGKWIDRWTAGSPLVWNGIAYQTDIYQWLYVVDLASGKMLYRKEMDLEGLTHYNAVAVAASPTLVGKHILVCDNQGTTLVLEPGPMYKVVARNRIGTVLDRSWPIPAQETLTYSPPIADGSRLYLRGEAYLYCIGEK
ncbi:MAG: PQQ-binding-like beta-propeller repeat protein [Planctomycetia bacterium]|nr:PQQ-binding-like beta-propeller repeat protein [Planctomycetia bacterium]